MRWRRISLKLLHPSLQRSNGDAADAMFAVWAVSSSTSASVVWICAEIHLAQLCLPAQAVTATYLLHLQASARQASADLFARIHRATFLFFFVFANSSNGAWNGVQSEAVIGGFVPWEKRPVLLAARWATDVFHAFHSWRGPLWWRWRALLDSGPVKVHEDYLAARIKTGHTSGITHRPGSSLTASRRGGDRQHK